MSPIAPEHRTKRGNGVIGRVLMKLRSSGGTLKPSSAILLLFVVSVTALPYLPALRYGFVFDDLALVVNNLAIRSWQYVPAYFLNSVWKFVDPASNGAYYRPFFFLWLRVNDALFGLRPFSWHLASLAAHLGVTALVFLLLRRHFEEPWIAAAGALIFGVHPVHIESVVWVSGATDPLAALGFLGSLLLWLKSAQALGIRWRIASLACYAAALLIKETAIVLPAILFVYALIGAGHAAGAAQVGSGRFVRAIRQTLPYLAVTALYLAVRVGLLRGLGGASFWASRYEVLLTAPSLLLFYARHLFWPAGLSLLYDFSIVSSARNVAFWLPVLVLAGASLCAWAWLPRKRDPAVPLAVAWFLLPLLPVWAVVLSQPGDLVHDRYLYLPSIGLAIATGFLLKTLIGQNGRGRPDFLAGVVVSLLVAGLGISTMIQSSPWQDNISLYTHALEYAPKNPVARNKLADLYAAAGRFQEANDLLAPLVVEHPNSWSLNKNFGYVNYHLKRLELAEKFLLRAIAIDPRDADQFLFLGQTYLREGRLADAEEQFRQAIAKKPDGEGYHFALGIVLMEKRDLTRAKSAFLEELKYHPESPAAHMELAFVEQLLQRPQ